MTAGHFTLSADLSTVDRACSRLRIVCQSRDTLRAESLNPALTWFLFFKVDSGVSESSRTVAIPTPSWGKPMKHALALRLQGAIFVTVLCFA
jgi:hypothetical protein